MSEQLITPSRIGTHLDKYVIGQDRAKKTLGVAVYNHHKRISLASAADGIEIEKSNILMTGPTGSGKTYLVTTLAKALGLPIYIADAIAITNSPDIEKAIQNIFIKLIEAAGGNVNLAQKGFVIIDEIDKLVSNPEKGEMIQFAMLKVIEGTIINLNIGGKEIPFDTKNVLFITCGAFVNLAPIVRARMAETGAGLLSDDELIKNATTMDFAKFGLIPEFSGRLPILVNLNTLDKKELVEILTVPVNAIVTQYTKMFALDGVQIIITKDALEEIAEQALNMKTGARGLRTVLEKVLNGVTLTAPKMNAKKVTITGGVIKGTEKVKYE